MELIETLKDWATTLQKDYETKLGKEGSDITYESFANSAKDFIDTFLKYADEI